MTLPTFRFAPSPNGYLHLGHAYSARLNYEWALRTGGRFLLRIEDIDLGRARPEFEDQIFTDLDWLGLNWEEPVLRQSEEFYIYQEALDRLKEMGLLYPCFATRREISLASEDNAKTDPEGGLVYPGLYRNLSDAQARLWIREGKPYALRLRMDDAASLAREISGGDISFAEMDATGALTRKVVRPERWGDVVLARKDAPGSYHIAVTVDDARQEVTHIIRGADLEAATDIHRVLQILLGLPEPAYHHHKLVTLPEGRKLSKSARDVSLKALREAGLELADLTAGELFELGRGQPAD